MGSGDAWYYETKIMRRYREGLEGKARALGTVWAVPGMGAPLDVETKSVTPSPAGGVLHLFSSGPAAQNAGDFLAEYQTKIRSMPPIRGGGPQFLEKLTEDERQVLATLLPAGAALKHRCPELKGEAVFEAIRTFCIREISRILAG
jgi:hypothetical protein